MKLKTLVESKDALVELLKEKLPFAVAMDLKKFVSEADKELIAFNEVRELKVREYGEDIGDGRIGIKDEEKLKLYLSELDTVMDRDIDIDIPTINSEHLTKAEISTKDLITLNWLIK